METPWTPEARGGSVRQRGLAELYRTHASSAFRVAYLITGDRALAEDLTHEAFIKVFGRIRQLRDESSFDAYLRQAVVNLSNSHFRRARLERRHLRGEVRGPMAVELPGVEERDELRTALVALPVRQRTAIVLRYYEDLSERETADIMGISSGAVRSLVARGMGDLRARVDPDARRAPSGGRS